MKRRSKLDMVIDIVDWEHRYSENELMGVCWVLDRIKFYMTSLTFHGVKTRWKEMFEL